MLNFHHIASKCEEIAARAHVSQRYAADLRHIALDCKCALDGCEASAESVDQWLESDPFLEGELGDDQFLPTASTVPMSEAA